MNQSLPNLIFNKCKQAGFCLAITENYDLFYSKLKKFDFNDVKNIVPIRVIYSRDPLNKNCPKHNLQKGFDAFHQEDYETAVLLFRMIVDDHAHMKDVSLYLGISYFFEKDHENAIRFLSYFLDNRYTSKTEIISWLLDLCTVVKNETTDLIPTQKSLMNCIVNCNI